MNDATVSLGKADRHRSQWGLAWTQLQRDKPALIGLGLILTVVFLGVFGSWLAPYDATEQNLVLRRSPPSLRHPMGLDEFGRDIMSRVLVGARYTVGASLVAVAIGLTAGVSLGLICGFYAGLADIVLMRLVDTLLAFPVLLLAIVIVGALGPGLTNAVVAVGIAAIPTYVRVVRATTFALKENEYVLAARAVGVRSGRTLVRHIFPNALAPIIVITTVGIAQAMLATAALSFLGLGAQPPTPEWGAMLSQGRAYLFDAPHISVFPGLAIVFAMLGFNLLGDGLRDAIDPRMRTEA